MNRNSCLQEKGDLFFFILSTTTNDLQVQSDRQILSILCTIILITISTEISPMHDDA